MLDGKQKDWDLQTLVQLCVNQISKQVTFRNKQGAYSPVDSDQSTQDQAFLRCPSVAAGEAPLAAGLTQQGRERHLDVGCMGEIVDGH
jgi:hypothetical protein